MKKYVAIFSALFVGSCHSGRSEFRTTGQKQTAQPASERAMQILRRKHYHRRLFEPANEGPQNLRRTGAVGTSVATGCERSDAPSCPPWM